MSSPGDGIAPHIESPAAQQLRENEERLRLAIDAASMGAWDWDFATGKVHWSGDQEKLFGLAPGTFDGTFAAFRARVHPDDVAGIELRLQEAIASRRIRHRDDFRVVRADGSIRWMVANGRIFYDDSGVPIRMIGVNLDVTESKHAEEALRESEKLAAAGRVAATIAHEINNPLASVMNLLYLTSLESSLSQGARAYLTMADEELRRMSHIVKQTLAFHRQSSTPLPVSISDLIENLLVFHERSLSGVTIRLIRKLEGEHECHGYPGELRQVFSNLMQNAIQAMPAGGTLMIHVRRSRNWSSFECEPGTRIVIADSGTGIAREHLAHIFEPFFTTKRDKGSGLGLWVVDGIVRRHRGTVHIVSSAQGPRRGTTVSLFFPAASMQAATDTERKAAEADRITQMRLRFSSR